MAWEVSAASLESSECFCLHCSRADRNSLWTQSSRAVCTWSLTKIEICLFSISWSFRHLSRPLSLPSFFFSSFFPNFFFFFFKLRTAWHGVREWGRRAGEKVMGYTIASHTTFKCFSLRHSGNWAWAGLDNVSLCVSCSLHCGKLNCGAIMALCCAFVNDSFLRNTQQGNTSTGPAAFSLAGKRG